MIILRISMLILYFLQPINSLSVLYSNSFQYISEKILKTIVTEKLNTTTLRWITQKIDHFDDQSDTWKMRYYENLEFFHLKGPIYIFVGGEGEANPDYLSTGMIRELAKETKGAMLLTEHRYYGKSQPFNKMNVTNLKWLTSRQALADLAYLIKQKKSLPIFKSSKVVLIGGSYAGNLAAWMRLIYPDLVDAAIASSAPVLAKKDFYEYIEKVTENYGRFGDDECVNIIKENFNNYREMFQTSKGSEQLRKIFNICSDNDLSVIENQRTFFTFVTDSYIENSQYGGVKKIENHCMKLQDTSIIADDVLGNETDKCLDVSYKNVIETYINTSWTYAWFYQTCTEFAYFQTTSSDLQMFGKILPLEYFLKGCQDMYGSEFNERRVDNGVEATNELYGGLNPNVSKVVFVNGELDPWSTISVIRNLSNEAPAIVIPRETHCADFFPNQRGASEELKAAGKRIKTIIKGWINVNDES